MAEWNALFNAPNAGQAFSQAFQQGQQTSQQNTARSAMAALIQDPNNQKALHALASVDPQAAQQFQQQQIEHTHQQLQLHQENILRGAEIIRQMQPKDDASWQQALRALISARSRRTTTRNTHKALCRSPTHSSRKRRAIRNSSRSSRAAESCNTTSGLVRLSSLSFPTMARSQQEPRPEPHPKQSLACVQTRTKRPSLTRFSAPAQLRKS
jgi:hypothetical protein